jgi:hypothetical protein
MIALFALFALLFAQSASAAEPAKHSGFEFSAGESKLKIYGFARLDLFYDDSKTNDPQVVQWVRSESDSLPLSANVARENDAQFNMHPKLSRIGVDLTTAGVTRLSGAKIAGKVEIDFFGATTSESRDAVRMRHAYGKLNWTSSSLLLGQTSDLISPFFPIVNLDFVMWNAGNLADRRPQARFELAPNVGKNKVLLQAMVGVTGAVDNQTLDGGAGAGNLDGVDAAYPTMQARGAFAGKAGWAAEQPFELGIWVHNASEKLPEGTAPIGTADDWTSEAFGADLKLPIHKSVTFEAEAWSGKNLDDVRGGIGQGVNVTAGDPALGEEIESTGGWAQLGFKANEVYSVYVGGTLDDPEDGLPASGARDKNEVYYLAQRFNAGGGLLIGLDYLNWTTEWTGGMPDGTDNRFNLFGQYNF